MTRIVDYSTAGVLTLLSKAKISVNSKLESETVEFKKFSTSLIEKTNRGPVGYYKLKEEYGR